ncbi:MAG TPA: hypothetical protein VFA79_04255 [Myxococcales bacterium]|jgi:hypothetical protein|nr:hypothetical protein [Myxococcales bacterium]
MAGPDQTDVLETMRRVRDAGMDAWARTTHQVTRSSRYARLTGLLSQPGLIAAAIFRKASEKAMARLLGQLNMPSRADVLSVSQRLTHIETAIDDLSATLDAVKAAAAPQTRRAPAREKQLDGERPRWRAGDR